MLVSMIEMMKIAKKERYCIPATSVENEHSVRACIDAAVEKRSPIILISMFRTTPDIYSFGRIVRDIANSVDIPVAVCQDHGATFEEAIWGIRAGYTDIMVDRSSLSFEENVAQVKELVKIAHAVGVGVEAELGHVGVGDDYDTTGQEGLTVPSDAIEFVKQTGVDALAVAIGTAHGVYKGVPKIQFDLLKELDSVLDVPLVLHGSSGTGKENLTKVSQMGITKMNIANDLKRTPIEALAAADTTGMGAYRMYPILGEAMKGKVMEYIDICGSANKA